MLSAVSGYFERLFTAFGDGWTRFWFRPSDPTLVAILRILTGLVAFVSIATYTPDLLRFFGPGGLLSVETVDALRGPEYIHFSYLDYLRTTSALWAAHIAGLLVLALYTLGALTRLTSILALVVTLSYWHRAPVLTSQFEPVLSFLIFYLCLAPAGSRFSLDAWWKGRRASAAATPAIVRPRWDATVATRLIQVHMATVYLMMVLAQLQADVWWDGMAVWWLLVRPDSSLVDLRGLSNSDFVLNGWTHAIVLFELLFPILAWNRLAAPLLVALSVVIWLSVGLVTGMLTFAAVMIIGSLAFWPEPATVRVAANPTRAVAR